MSASPPQPLGLLPFGCTHQRASGGSMASGQGCGLRTQTQALRLLLPLAVDLSFFICKMGLTTVHRRTMLRTKGGDKGRVFRWPCRHCWY